MNFSKSLFVVAVSACTLSLSACGKKKEDAKLVDPAPQAQPQADAGTPAPTAVDRNAPVDPKAPGAQPAPQGQRGVTPNPRVQRPGQPAESNSRRHGHSQQPDISAAPEAQPTEDESADLSLKKKLTGAKNKAGLLYTGSSTDDVLEILKRKAALEEPAQAEINLAAAQSVVDVSMTQEPGSKDLLVILKMKENKKVVTYVLVSALDENIPVKLSSVREANSVRTSGALSVSGQAMCLDVDTSQALCSNVLLSLGLGQRKTRPEFKILVRDSVADLKFDLKGMASLR